MCPNPNLSIILLDLFSFHVSTLFLSLSEKKQPLNYNHYIKKSVKTHTNEKMQ